MKYCKLIVAIAMALLAAMGSGAEYRYRLTLDGKPESDWTTLSERAVERRARLGIESDSTDLEVSPVYLAAIREAGLTIVTQSRWLNTVVVMRENGAKITDWSALSFVTKVETLTTTQHAKTPIRNANLDGPGKIDNCRTPVSQVNALKPLYEANYRGQGMLIAVLDAGFTRINTWDWLMERVVGYRDMYAPLSGEDRTFTGDTHGACCFSIMASPVSHGVCGTAQEADYYLIRTETDDSETQLEEDMWVAGAELADSLGVDVISSSLGYYDFDAGLEDHTWADFTQGTVFISRGARIACQKGMLVCNAAGNEGDNSWKRLIFPADEQDVLTVGGVNNKGQAAYFTSRGFTVPYVKPDVSARAIGCFTVSPYYTDGRADSNGAGTSYATPLIAGACASLWSAVPQLTPAQLRDVVRESASKYASPDSILGYGLPDFGVALELARALVGEEEGIDIINADAPQKGTDIYYNLMGQPIGKEPRRGFCIDPYLRRKSFSFQQK